MEPARMKLSTNTTPMKICYFNNVTNGKATGGKDNISTNMNMMTKVGKPYMLIMTDGTPHITTGREIPEQITHTIPMEKLLNKHYILHIVPKTKNGYLHSGTPTYMTSKVVK